MTPAKRLSAAEAQERAARAARLLAEDPRIVLVYLFGSAAGGGSDLVRDVDLAVFTDPPWSLTDLVRQRARLVGAVAAPLDLVSLNDASTVLAHEVVETGQCLYARSPEAETAFVTRSRARHWDFKPYRDAQWRLAGERLAERWRGP